MRGHTLRVLILLLSIAADASAQTTRPVPAIERIVIVSIDGARPDLLLRANCPAVRSLMDAGSYSLWARTTAMSVTLPSHVSMLTGVTPQRHGILWNDELPLSTPVYPKFPTLFELAHAAGYSTALVSGKPKFKDMVRPGSVDWAFINEDKEDSLVVSNAVKVIREHRPQVLVVHFPGPDVVGHARGWGGPEQIAALEASDAGIARILAALDELSLRQQTVVLVSADHGGAGRGHGPDDPRSRHIPWIITGPGIRKNYDLTREPRLDINTEDTFATACFLLALKLPKPNIDGRVVKEILEDRQLLGTDTPVREKP